MVRSRVCDCDRACDFDLDVASSCFAIWAACGSHVACDPALTLLMIFYTAVSLLVIAEPMLTN
jgi:hypothetical protein